MSAHTSRGWCFTFNNPFDHNWIPGSFNRYLDLLVEKGKVVYWVYQYEIGENGTEHYQGYIHLKREQVLEYLRKWITPHAHYERARGTPAQNKEYCTKDDTRIDGDQAEVGPWEGGDFDKCGQGARTDVLAFVSSIRKGSSNKQLLEEHPALFLRHGSGIQRVRTADLGKRMGPPCVILFQGPSGCGKTRCAVEYAEKRNLSYYLRTPMGEWFEGYNGENVCILDEVDKYEDNSFSLGLLLRVLDRYPVSVPLKGASAEMVSTTMILTAVNEVRDWYDNAEAPPQIERRITTWYKWDQGRWVDNTYKLYRGIKREEEQPEVIVID